MNPHEVYARAAAYELRDAEAPTLLVLLHGLGGDRHQPLALVEGTCWEGGTTVLAPDARGHGETDVVGEAADFSIAAMAEDLLALLAHLDQTGKPTYLAGISMGAALALRTCLARRLDVRGLSLVRPAFSDQAEPENLAPLVAAGRFLDEHGEHADPAAFTAGVDYRHLHARTPLGAASLLAQVTAPQAYRRRVRLTAVPASPAYTADELAELDLPTLVVGVDRDPVHPLDLARRWAGAIPGAHLVTAPPRDADANIYDRTIHAAVQDHVQRTLEIRGQHQPSATTPSPGKEFGPP